MKNKIKKPKRKQSKKYIYLDHASATPTDQRVFKELMDYERVVFANPSSIHALGVRARSVIEEARLQIAERIFAHSDEIIFTGSGTESNALAILGVISNNELLSSNEKIKIPHIITSSIEHPAVLENIRMLEKTKKAEVSYIDPDASGIINPKDIQNALKGNTVLVSVMYANNEIGTIQPIQEIAKVIRRFRKTNMSIPGMDTKNIYPIFHTDACQAMNYLPTENIEKLGVDLMTWNSSKIYGPKGVGFLYKKRIIKINPLYVGGGQELGLRSGTEQPASIKSAALAFSITCDLKEKESKRLIAIRDHGIKKLLALSKTTGYEIRLNGDSVRRLPNNINISVSGLSSELLVIELDAKGIYVSAKSACKSDEPDESYVISVIRQAEGKSSINTDGSLRISLGRQTTKKDVDTLAHVFLDILLKYKAWK